MLKLRTFIYKHYFLIVLVAAAWLAFSRLVLSNTETGWEMLYLWSGAALFTLTLCLTGIAVKRRSNNKQSQSVTQLQAVLFTLLIVIAVVLPLIVPGIPENSSDTSSVVGTTSSLMPNTLMFIGAAVLALFTVISLLPSKVSKQ